MICASHLTHLQVLESTLCNTTKFVPTLVRDEVPVGGHQLSNTFQQMGIQMSCGTKAGMDNAVAACDCANNPVSRDLSLSSPSLSSCSLHTAKAYTLALFSIHSHAVLVDCRDYSLICVVRGTPTAWLGK